MNDSDHKEPTGLFEALLLLKDSHEYEQFFKDLCTPQELAALKERWKVCQMLKSERSYREINSASGVSLATIGRVARFLREESYGGYRLILDRLARSGDSS